jgi:hypothetical protein
MSKQWACETLRVGYEDLMAEALEGDEKVLITEIQDRETENNYPYDLVDIPNLDHQHL